MHLIFFFDMFLLQLFRFYDRTFIVFHMHCFLFLCFLAGFARVNIALLRVCVCESTCVLVLSLFVVVCERAIPLGLVWIISSGGLRWVARVVGTISCVKVRGDNVGVRVSIL